jgi:carbon starvation protein
VDTLLVAVLSFFGFIVAYRTYGRWLSQRIFRLDNGRTVPSVELEDGADYVPTKRAVVFGHHFTSIAGTGPIVGPAIAVFWGWLPALLWVVFGSIFIGAVHDFGALVVSLRNQGKTVGELSGRYISPRARLVFLLILFFALTIVLGVFGLVIAIIFSVYPETVLSVWIEVPIAVVIGWWAYKKGGDLLVPSIIALGMMYGAIYVGCYYLPIDLGHLFGLSLFSDGLLNSVVVWTALLFLYCSIASVLPVWTLLQPRDYINSHQLVMALGLLVLGVLVAGVTGQAQLMETAPAIATEIPPDAPPIFPFLFVTIACGAISGFHCLVSSGTSSKQLCCETDAQYVGYGAMLLEGALAVLVILCCCSGLGMGQWDRVVDGNQYTYRISVDEEGAPLLGNDAWRKHYSPVRHITTADGSIVQKGGWNSHTLANKIEGFVEGGANFLSTLGIPIKLGIAIIAVLVASFAATTLDTATRLQRYVVTELGKTVHIPILENKYMATGVAVVAGLLIALTPGANGPGSGGLILWPLFGAINQLLAGLAFMVLAFYLKKTGRPLFFMVGPAFLMLILPAWAMLWNMFNAESGWLMGGNTLLLGFGVFILTLQAIMVWEGWKLLRRWSEVELEEVA